MQGVRLGAGREGVLQQHSGADRGAYQSGAAAKRLRVGDGNTLIAKCWGNVDRRREVSHGG